MIHLELWYGKAPDIDDLVVCDIRYTRPSSTRDDTVAIEVHVCGRGAPTHRAIVTMPTVVYQRKFHSQVMSVAMRATLQGDGIILHAIHLDGADYDLVPILDD